MRKNYTVQYRRKRNGKTDYNLRLRLLGGRKPRLVIRRSNNGFTVQVVKFEEKGDKIIAMANTKELIKLGWKGHKGNRCAGYAIGFLCGKRAKEKGVTDCVLDLGRQRSLKMNSLYAVLKGFLESNINVPHNSEMLPDEDTVNGKYIEEYAKKIGKSFKDYSKQIVEIKNKAK